MINDEIIKKVFNVIRSGADSDYFFKKITSPDWIKPFSVKKIFYELPSEGSFPPLEYLERMSALFSEHHGLIGKIICDLPETNNMLVHLNCLEILINIISSKHGLEILEKELAWFKSQSTSPYWVVDKFGDLLSVLAQKGYLKEALKVADCLLSFSYKTDEVMGIFNNKLVTKYDWLLHKNILEKNFPDLVKLSWNESLILLCQLLNKAIDIEMNSKAAAEKTRDHSHIWRRTIENSNYITHDVKDFLINAIIVTSQTVVEQKLADITEVLRILKNYSWNTFNRVALYLLKKFASDTDLSFIEIVLTNSSYYNDDCYHELYELLKVFFPKLDKLSQEKIIKVVLEKDFTYLKSDSQDAEFDKAALADKERRQLKYLEPISSYLPDDIQQYYKSLVLKYGELKHKGFNSAGSQTWVGPESPLSLEDLQLKTPEELIHYLKIWTPPIETIFGPSKRGLGHQLKQLVSTEPNKYIPYINKLIEVPEPTYISNVFLGFREAVNQKKIFSWGALIELCLWVLENEDQIPFRDSTQVNNFDIDPDWTLTKLNIASLFGLAFSKSDECEIQKELDKYREKVWKILEKLTDDPNPSLEDENKYSDSEDLFSLSINSVRGEALHAVIYYSLWLYERHKAEAGENIKLIPEIKAVLEKHLNKISDPLLSIHTVYGKWLPWLILLDEEWAKKVIPLIFPSDNDNFKFRKVAWKTYIYFCSPYSNVFNIIKDEYNFWISRLPSESLEKDYSKNLAQHLMAFYGQGLLIIEDLKPFFENASPQTRADAISFIGFRLRNLQTVSNNILNNFKLLWESRCQVIEDSFDFESHFQELDSFVWWFESMRFDLTWSFQQLKKVLNKIKFPNHNNSIFSSFRKLCSQENLDKSYYEYMLDCLEIMITSDKGKQKSHWWYWDVEFILEQCMLHVQNEDLRKKINRLIDFVGALGHNDVKKLREVKPNLT